MLMLFCGGEFTVLLNSKCKTLLGNTQGYGVNHEQKGGTVKHYGFDTGKRHRESKKKIAATHKEIVHI